MSDKEAVRLAHHIIENHFGPLVAQVAHPLLHRGRLNTPALCKLCKLAPRPVRASLIVLMQHNLLWWTGPQPVEAGKPPPLEAYEVNIKAIMDLVRVGRVVETARNAFGDEAAEIVYLLLFRGKLKLSQILETLATRTVTSEEKDREDAAAAASTSSSSSKKDKEKDKKGKSKRKNQVEESEDEDDPFAAATGTTSTKKKLDSKKSAHIQSVLLTLLKASYILPFHPSQLVSPRDKLITWRKEELAAITGGLVNQTAQKERNYAYERASKRVADERAEWSDVKRAIKRTGSSKSSKSKKIKLDDDVETIDESIYLFVNFDKFTLQIRNELVVKAASDRFNVEAGLVVDAMLKATKDTQLKITEIKTDPVSLHQISQNLPKSIKLHKGIFDPSSNIDEDSPTSTLIQAFCALLAAEDNPTALGMMSQFISKTKSSRDSTGSYAVEFEVVCRRLKRRVLDAVVRERWGDDAARVMTVVLKHEKMDEKHISKVAMLASKDVRVITASLSSASLLELQEVPKSAERLPARTFYLWHVDLARAYTALISHLYKTMANLIQRRKFEVGKMEALIEKRNRTDVKESEGELLSKEDKAEIKRLDEVVEKLTLAEQRTDMNVFILRDLPGGPRGVLSLELE